MPARVCLGDNDEDSVPADEEEDSTTGNNPYEEEVP